MTNPTKKSSILFVGIFLTSILVAPNAEALSKELGRTYGKKMRRTTFSARLGDRVFSSERLKGSVKLIYKKNGTLGREGGNTGTVTVMGKIEGRVQDSVAKCNLKVEYGYTTRATWTYADGTHERDGKWTGLQWSRHGNLYNSMSEEEKKSYDKFYESTYVKIKCGDFDSEDPALNLDLKLQSVGGMNWSKGVNSRAGWTDKTNAIEFHQTSYTPKYLK